MAREGPWKVHECLSKDQWSSAVGNRQKVKSGQVDSGQRDMYVLCNKMHPFSAAIGSMEHVGGRATGSALVWVAVGTGCVPRWAALGLCSAGC